MFVNRLIYQRLLNSNTGDNDGGGNTPRTFTQEEVDQILSKRLSKFSKLEDQLNAILQENNTLKSQINDLDEKAKLAGKTELEKLQHEIAKRDKMLETVKADFTNQLNERDQRISGYETAIRKNKVQSVIGSALQKAKVHKDAINDALDQFERTAEIDYDDKSGKVTRIVINDRPYDDPIKAAQEFLKAKPWFASAPSGGGTNHPGGVGNGGSLDPDKVSADELMSAGYSEPAKRTFGGNDPVSD